MGHEFYLHILLGKKCKSLHSLKIIHARAVVNGVQSSQHIACKLLNSYVTLGNTLEAHKVFDQIPNPDIVSWTCLISLYLRTQRPSKAFSLFSDMVLHHGLKPDSYSVVAALSACGRISDLYTGGKAVHGIIFRCHLASEKPIVGNALIDMYCRNGKIGLAELVFANMETKDVASWTSLLNGFIMSNDLDLARVMFDKMPLRNTISWTAMIAGCVRGKIPIEALALFRQMTVECQDPSTAITIVAVLSACADIGSLDFGRSVHAFVHKDSLSLDVAVQSALMDMYAKSGNLDSAITIFNEILKKDAYSWNIMLSGFALHGEGHSALRVFYDMIRSETTPDSVTFTCVLSACSHAGLLTEGQRLFNSMIHSYGLNPEIEHYGCMVDLLGRAGLLEDAKRMIEQMTIEADSVIWRSLLSSCLLHGNLEIAQVAANELIKLEPGDDGVYVLLWNIYCTENKWREASITRKMMKNQRVKKRPGCSWLQLNGVVQQFLADDTTHSDLTNVYSLLQGIAQQSRNEDYLVAKELTENLYSSR